ncbi:MAG: thioredoxin domain-containing protein [Acidimicrobiia bacterium]|nr:thioredoxin domain-containing protein [Acidimicrobiia bacterium]
MTNRLAQETSPYLRQHKDNPVDWFSWSTEAFTEAQRRGVPILLSVGYSACHWCHVMAHECFEDLETATMMNELFVNIKVDREERPDIDALYMDAVQAMSGRGGWPMTVFMSPDGNPFFGGTYFPKPSFMKLMVAVHDAWQNRRADIENNISALSESLSRSALITPDVSLPSFELVAAACDQLAESFDPKWGGFGGAPKFPSTMNLDLLLRVYNDSPNDSLGTIITTTLDAMASGGIYDHIGGGFSRYSVDEKWLVPHFEKMLYDQALLLRVYSHAAVVFESENYRQICEEIVDYVVRDLRDLEGGFFSAEDADSLDQHGHSHEGHFYVFSPDDLRAIWLEFAETNCEFLYRELRVEDSLSGLAKWMRSWQRDGKPKARHRALACDLAHLVDAFTRLGESSGKAIWVSRAIEVAEQLTNDYWDVNNGGLFTVATDTEQLIVRQKDLLDNATPSANSTAAIALHRLGTLTGNQKFTQYADSILRLFTRIVAASPSAFGNLLHCVYLKQKGSIEVVVTGDRPELVETVKRLWLPTAVLAFGQPFDSPLWRDRRPGFAYVCRDYACNSPITTVQQLHEALA